MNPDLQGGGVGVGFQPDNAVLMSAFMLLCLHLVRARYTPLVLERPTVER